MSQTTTQATPTIDQQRAKHAWDAVERLQVPSDEADDYAREAKKLPVRIMTAGLGQALAFLRAKQEKKKGLAKLEADLTDWAKQRLEIAKQYGTLLEAVLGTNSEFLRRATDEMLAYVGWINRFTEAKGLPQKGEKD